MAAAPCAGGRPPGRRCVLLQRQRNSGAGVGPFMPYRKRMGRLCDGIGPEVNVNVIFASIRPPGDFSAMSDELCFLPATELRARIVRKDVSPVDITRAVLARAERMQPDLNCFIPPGGDGAEAGPTQPE